MKAINWTATAALLRTLLILGASTFAGAIVLPMGANGTLPITWAAWKPILAVGATAAIVAEWLWIRTHLSQAAQALGLPAAPPNPTAAATNAAKTILIVIGLGLLLRGTTACVTAQKIVPPAVASASCVVDDAVAGKSLSQIEQDCGGDVAQLIGVLIDPTTYAKVKDTPAYAETQRVKLALKATP